MAGTLAARSYSAQGMGAPAQAPIRGALVGVVRAYNLYDSGRFRVHGDVGIAGTPDTMVSRRVRLHDVRDGRLVREVWSAPGSGVFAFDYLRAGTFYVVTHDHEGVYNAVVKDRIAAEPMP